MGWFNDQMSKQQAFAAAHKHDCNFAGAYLMGDTVKHGLKKWPVAECSAEFQTGEQLAKMSASRVVGGAVLLGPLGAVLGGMAKKDKSKAYVALQTPDGPVVLEGPMKDQKDAMQFAANINAAAPSN